MHDRKRDRTGHYAFYDRPCAFFKALAREIASRAYTALIGYTYRDQGKAKPSTTNRGQLHRRRAAWVTTWHTPAYSTSHQHGVRTPTSAEEDITTLIIASCGREWPHRRDNRKATVKGIRHWWAALMTLTERTAGSVIIVKTSDYHAAPALSLAGHDRRLRAKEFEYLLLTMVPSLPLIGEIVEPRLLQHPVLGLGAWHKRERQWTA